MVGNEIRKARANDAIVQLMLSPNGCVFFTLTTPDVVSFSEIRQRWASLRHWLLRELRRRSGGAVHYIMNYEVHPGGHGWHIHAVFSSYIDLRKYLCVIRSFGFGRVNVKRVDSAGVSEYLTKHALKAYARRCKSECNVTRSRLVNTSRGLPTLSDYHYLSETRNKTKENLMILKGYGFRPWKRLVFQCAEISALLSLSSDRQLLSLYNALLNNTLEYFLEWF